MAKEEKVCESCSMPMKKAEEHDSGDIKNPYCVYCTDKTGKLKSRQEVREGMIQFYMSQMGKTKKEAGKFVDKQRKKFPAWKEN